jgi:hypothetical protein
MTIGELKKLLEGRDESEVVCIYDIPADSPAISTGGFGAVVPVDDEVEHKIRADDDGSRIHCFCFTASDGQAVHEDEE